MNIRKFYDRLAGYFIVLGGVAIIASILAVFVFILAEVLPLFSKPTGGSLQKTALSSHAAGALGVGVDEYMLTAYAVLPDGKLKFFSVETGEAEKTFDTGSGALSFSVQTDSKGFALGGTDGFARIFTLHYQETHPDGVRKVVSEIKKAAEVPVAAGSGLLSLSFVRPDSQSVLLAAHTEDGRLIFVSGLGEEEDQNPFADKEPGDEALRLEFSSSDLTTDIGDEKITAVAFLENGNILCAATSSGRILQWKISGQDSPVFLGSADATENRSVGVTMMGLVLGGRSVVVGDSSGGLSVWFRPSDEDFIKPVHKFTPFEGAVRKFSNSLRNRGFVASDSLGGIGVFHATTAQRRLFFQSGEEVSALVFAPKGNAVAALSPDGSFSRWDVKDDYPEITLKSVFSAVWYEGYDSPIHMWQSTGGTDEFEPKLGLLPIIFGTFKGAVYSLIFAVPLAVLAALCVSQFMHPSFTKYIKPVIEIMAGLPSVVIGFFAGLWLSPILEKIFPALVIMPFTVTAFALACLYLWKIFGKNIRRRLRQGTEYLLLVPVLAASVAFSLWLNAPAEQFLFQGDYKIWLASIGLDFDQRNALVVGFAMGFAVIPIVFTIAEDAMSGVPKPLVAASLALGASRWQTAVRVVVPSASAGILSAVVIGFGRAVGETMIVLMATGNTPLLDWNIFNGFRAMSANIAVELPEAPHGGGLYRLIFFTSLLLFLFTFFLNTVAEFVRGRLGRKYRSS